MRMKNCFPLKKNDIFLILFLLFLACLPLFFTRIHEKEALFAHITVNGKTEHIIRLTPEQEEEFTITTAKGANTIHIHNGTVSVRDADCPDQICVKSIPIRQAGEIIACLPHKLLIEVKPSEKQE